MNKDIKTSLDEFHRCNDEARKHFRAHELHYDRPLGVDDQKALMMYAMWRTKADIALNEFHTKIAQQNSAMLAFNVDSLELEHDSFVEKLGRIEKWLEEHV